MTGLRVLDRYILRELFWPFLFGMMGFVVVIAIDPMITAMKHVINQDIDPFTVAKWFFFSLTNDMVFTFPMAMLLSALLTFGRLSKDCELIAIQSGGIGFRRLLIPVMVFAVGATGVAFLFSEFVMPFTTRRAAEIRKTQILRILPLPGTDNVTIKDSPDRTLFVGRAYHESGRLENVVITDYRSQKEQERSAHSTPILRRTFAKSGQFVAGRWIFSEVKVYEVDRHLGARLRDDLPRLEIPLQQKPEDFKRQDAHFNEMSMRALWDRIRYLSDHGLSEVVSTLVEFYLKTSIPFACLIFGMIGAALGTSQTRSGAMIGFGISILITFVYYVVLSLARSYGKNGVISPLTAAWLANVIFFTAGLFLVARVKN